MADENNPNGGNGGSNGGSNPKNGKVGLVERVTTGVKDDIQALKTDIPTKAKEQIEGLKDPTKTQVYTSIFRHKHDDTPRNRALGVLSNVFLHLHPAKINRDAVRYSYTWGMGGITFYLFIILTYTGVLLMFYYHPSKVQAFRDVLYLEHDVPFGKILRNMHRWAAHLMVIGVWLHMFRVFLTGSYKKPREFNWNIGVLLLVFTLLLSFTGYLLPDDQLGFWAVTVGTNMARATPLLGARRSVRLDARHDSLQRRALRIAGRIDRGCECAAAVLHLALHRDSDRGVGADDRALLARAKRRRNFWSGSSDAGSRSGQAAPRPEGRRRVRTVCVGTAAIGCPPGEARQRKRFELVRDGRPKRPSPHDSEARVVERLWTGDNSGRFVRRRTTCRSSA